MTPCTVMLMFILAIGQVEPAAPANARDPRSVIESALRDYDLGVAAEATDKPEADALFERARAGFQSLVDAGLHNGHIYYNLANALVRTGDIPRAIVNYRRAQRLLPSDNDVRRNLAHARSLREIQIEPRTSTTILRTIFFWHFDTSPASRTAAAIGVYAGFWFLLGAMLFTKRRVPGLRGLAFVLGVTTVALGVSVWWDIYGAGARPEGVIVANQAVLRKGNGDAYDPQLDRPLPGGVEFRVLETRTSGLNELWHHVELPDGKDGWLHGDQVELI